jgi:Helix-turn-helix domain
MSWSATAYVKKLKAAPDGTPLTKGQKLLLFVLADYHNEERGYAWASLTRIATESLLSRSGVIRAIKTLQIKGILHIIRDLNASKTRVTNRYQFHGIDDTSRCASTLPLGAPVHYPRCASTLPLGAPVHHIFPKNLSNQSLQKKEKPTVCELTYHDETEVVEANCRFQEFWQTYPPRNGKRLEQAATKALFLQLSVQDQVLAVQAARNYAEAIKAQGLNAKDPKRFLRDLEGHEPWRDWITPAVLTREQRPPPPPPKTDPIGRGHWTRVYGNPRDHGYV